MTISAAVIKIGEKPTSSDTQIAIGIGDKKIHEDKKCGGVSCLDPITPSDKFKMKTDDLQEYKNWQETEKEYYECLELVKNKESDIDIRVNAYLKMRILEMMDPGVPGVIRLNQVAEKSMEDLFIDSGKFNRLDLDIKAFGAINNNLGYAKADEIFREIFQITKKHFPDVYRIRFNGGGLSLLIDKEIPEEKKQDMKKEIDQYLREYFNPSKYSNPREKGLIEEAIAEASEKQALKSLISGDFEKSFAFGKIGLSEVNGIDISPKKIFKEIFARKK